jgi:hypothetical protein
MAFQFHRIGVRHFRVVEPIVFLEIASPEGRGI